MEGAATAMDIEMKEAGPLPGQRDGQGDAVAAQEAQPRSRVVKPGDKRSKKGKRRIDSGAPPPLAPDDYVKVVPVSKRSEVLHDGQWRPVSLSTLERAAQIELSENLRMATSKKGYRMVRATHGACEGAWYYEATIVHLGSSGHVRLGWSTRKGELQAPVGYDEHSFGYRDLEGSKVHKALREEYGEPFQEGDVIGCYLHLGEGGRPFEKEKSDIVTWKGAMYFKEDNNALEQSKPLKNSIIGFSRNGDWQGVAYKNVLEGTYYPAVSIYTLPSQLEGASVSLNFGPEFKYSQPTEVPPASAVSTFAGQPPAPSNPDPPSPPGGVSSGPVGSVLEQMKVAMIDPTLGSSLSTSDQPQQANGAGRHLQHSQTDAQF